jgi:hypothetical protein
MRLAGTVLLPLARGQHAEQLEETEYENLTMGPRGRMTDQGCLACGMATSKSTCETDEDKVN